jgi:hypothetical protein
VRKFISIFLILAGLSTGGCAIFDAEAHNRGGYLDKVMDDHWFKADSKRMRALRAYALQASLARIASISPKNGQDRELMARRIGNASARATNVIACGFTTNPATNTSIDADPCFYFDSLMVDYTTALFDLAMVSFPIEDTQKLLNIVVGGISGPVAALDMLNALIGLAQEALKYGRVVGALYRDTVELEVLVWLNSPNVSQPTIPQQFQITPATVAGLKQIYARGNDNMVAWTNEIAAIRAAGFEPVPDIKFVYEISKLIGHLCSLVTPAPATSDPTSAYAACVKDLILPAPAASAAPGGTAAKTTMSKFPGALFSGGSASFSLPNTIEPTRRKTSAQTSQANGTPIITASTVASPAPESRQ